MLGGVGPETLPWHVARASGLVGWSLLTASVLLGLALSTKVSALGRRPRPNWLLDLHRYVGGLATLFVALHVAAVVADTYVGFDRAAVLVPFASDWRPSAVAWGVVAMYLAAAVEMTSLARRHLPRRVWRWTHVASFPLFVSATVHGVAAGTDASTAPAVFAAAAAVAAVSGLAVLRVARACEPTPVRAIPARTEVAA
jgi:predicted ferric reductase